MRKRIKETLNQSIAFVALATIFAFSAFAQKPQVKSNVNREKIRQSLQEARAKTRLSVNQKTIASENAVSLTNSQNFQIGKDFSLAIFDAEGIDEYADALNYTIVDLVYLIDQLEGQPEATQLQRILKSVVRGTASAAQVKKEIETVSNSYLAKQKTETKWYFSAGQTSMNLLIATYMGEDVQVKKVLGNMQALIKSAPKSAPKTVLDPMNELAKLVSKTTFTEEDYAAIDEKVGNVIDAVSS
jgi:hypothetical protein